MYDILSTGILVTVTAVPLIFCKQYFVNKSLLLTNNNYIIKKPETLLQTITKHIDEIGNIYSWAKSF